MSFQGIEVYEVHRMESEILLTASSKKGGRTITRICTLQSCDDLEKLRSNLTQYDWIKIWKLMLQEIWHKRAWTWPAYTEGLGRSRFGREKIRENQWKSNNWGDSYDHADTNGISPWSFHWWIWPKGFQERSGSLIAYQNNLQIAREHCC